MQPNMPIQIIGTTLILLGGAVSVLFWVPRLLNRQRLKEILGRRYPLVFFIYLANGPFLFFLGLLLLLLF